MKGVVFTEFMEMVDQTWGMDMVDDLIDTVNPESNGAYTSVGTYDYEELVAYIIELNKKTEVPVPNLVKTFGNHLAKSFSEKFSDFFSDSQSTFDVLRKVDNHIHVEVRKLYPDAELPKFSFEDTGDNSMNLFYESTRNLPDLAEGLIEGCAKFFGEKIDIQRQGCENNGITQEVFKLQRL